MELECSFPCLQEPATDPYPEPDQSSPHPPEIFKSHFKIILSSALRSSSGFFFGGGFAPKLRTVLFPGNASEDNERTLICKICRFFLHIL
jgi:hypothetical protein